MTSPTVWDDVLVRAKAACISLSIPLDEPNTQRLDAHIDDEMWASFEIATGLSDRDEIGNLLWVEMGQVWLHVYVPSGSGARPAIVARKQISEAFRNAVGLPDGLNYLGMTFDPGAVADQPGNWAIFSVAVDYRFQDINTP